MKWNNIVLDLKDTKLDFIGLSRPKDIDQVHLRIDALSKMSPVISKAAELLIRDKINESGVKAVVQEPYFPDVSVENNSGVEIKTWFVAATEMSARFKESVNDGSVDLAIVAWIPEYVIFGVPVILGCWCGDAKQVASVRDSHYHNPPEYLLIRPNRIDGKKNLIQTNVVAYTWQDTSDNLKDALNFVQSHGGIDCDSESGQILLRELLSRYSYRPDSNYSKLDRIQHSEITKFQNDIMSTVYKGYAIGEWQKILANVDKDPFSQVVNQLIGIELDGDYMVDIFEPSRILLNL